MAGQGSFPSGFSDARKRRFFRGMGEGTAKLHPLWTIWGKRPEYRGNRPEYGERCLHCAVHPYRITCFLSFTGYAIEFSCNGIMLMIVNARDEINNLGNQTSNEQVHLFVAFFLHIKACGLRRLGNGNVANFQSLRTPRSPCHYSVFGASRTAFDGLFLSRQPAAPRRRAAARLGCGHRNPASSGQSCVRAAR